MVSTPHIPFVIDGYNIDPNNVRYLPTQIYNILNDREEDEEEEYYELSNSSVTPLPMQTKTVEYADKDDSEWRKVVMERSSEVHTSRAWTNIEFYREYPTTIINSIEKEIKKAFQSKDFIDFEIEEAFNERDESLKLSFIEVEEGKLYGMNYWSGINFYRNGEMQYENPFNYMYDYKDKNNLLIFKVKKVEPSFLYSGAKVKLITLHKVNEIEFNDLFW